MLEHDWIRALVGGALIGAASLTLMAVNGRIFGVSGILAGTLFPKTGDTAWRIAVVVGLVFGGALLQALYPQAFDITETRSFVLSVAGGALVGFGTRMGNGCTSGHGICGIGRLSKRSLAATITFVLTGIATATAMHFVGGGQ